MDGSHSAIATAWSQHPSARAGATPERPSTCLEPARLDSTSGDQHDRRDLSWPASSEVVDALGPGNIVMIAAEYGNLAEMATGFGQRGVPAEVVAKTALDCWMAYDNTNAPVGEHLADQLLLPLAIAGSGCFRHNPANIAYPHQR